MLHLRWPLVLILLATEAILTLKHVGKMSNTTENTQSAAAEGPFANKIYIYLLDLCRRFV
jgi:hypothetical protein